MQIERALRDSGAGSDLVYRRGADALLQKQGLRGVHQVLAPCLGRFGSWMGFHWPNLFRSRNAGNSRIHRSATTMVPTPPSAAAATGPSSAAAMPLSNSPNWLEALTNR